jgi:hypothetical protein
MIRDIVKIQQLVVFFVAAIAACILDAAVQLGDLSLAVLAALTGLGGYLVIKPSLDGNRAVWLRDGLIGLWAPVGLLLASTVVLLLGPDAVHQTRWLFIAQGGAIGILIKSIQR